MHRLVASVFGVGLILGRARGSDLGSGTLGALVAFPIAVLIGRWLGWPGQLAAAAVMIGVSVWATRPLVDADGDPGWVCIDEAAGVFVAVIGLGLWPGAVVAWLVFRFADIFKRIAPGVASAENLEGAVGVTADDVVAGLYGLAAGHVLQALI